MIKNIIAGLGLVLLLGCAAQPAYKSQTDAAISAADALQKQISTLADDISKSCAGDAFKARFVAIDAGMDALQMKIQNIKQAADAEVERLGYEIDKRNVSIAGLVLLLVALGWYVFKTRKLY